MGVYFTESLVKLKHTGAVEKTAESFQAVCERLLQCHLVEYRSLPGKWLETLLDRVKETDQCRDDIIRRSGGLPFALAAIFRAEPKNIPKIMLPSAMKSLIRVISHPDLYRSWSRIHALHILRHIFNDKALSTDAAAFIAQTVQLSLACMSDKVWEVRNAASLCFATLITRTVGYKNKIGSGTLQKSISAYEFFFRYPSLLEVMLEELKGVAEVLKSAITAVPVRLGPILLLLARLLPCETPPVKATSMQNPKRLLSHIQGTLSRPKTKIGTMPFQSA